MLARGETIDLTLGSDSEGGDSPVPPAQPRSADARDGPMPLAQAGAPGPSEDEQRKRIMAFAAGVNAAAKRQRVGPPGAAAAGAPQARGAGASGGWEGDGGSLPGTRGQGRRDARRGQSDQQLEGKLEAAAAGGGGSNLLLTQLHAERMARARQQNGGDTVAAHGGPPRSAPAEAAAVPAGSPPRSRPARGGAAGGSSAACTRGPVAPAASGAVPVPPATAASGGQAVGAQRQTLSLLQYNVWFNESVQLEKRMEAIGRIVADAGFPDFEVTPCILELLRSAGWWGRYVASDPPPGAPYFTMMLAHRAKVPGVSPGSFRRQPYGNSVMGRCLLTLLTTAGDASVAIATSHLESPCPPNGMFTAERTHQMREALRVLDKAPAGNVLFAGDLNWLDSRDGAPPLKAGWLDAWVVANPVDPGFTYDTRSNKMLVGSWPGSRLDRVLARLRDFRVVSMSLVGTEPIPGVSYTKTFRSGGSKVLPVLPSDHYGLLLRLEAA